MDERDIFIEALRKDPVGRPAFLDEACAGDAVLRRRIEVLLEAHAGAGSFLEHPAPEQVAASARCQAPTQTGRPVGDGPALDFLAPPTRPGALGRLGHYEVLGVVGQGGMGIVLRAFDDKLHRVVAIKVMAAELAASASARQRFSREARAAAAVAHEHVVTIHAVEEDHQPPYLVMQFVEGVSLQDKLDRVGPLGVKETLRIGMQVAEGLAAAHKQGLVHRDVKPANILLENGVERVKLTDFGLARAVDDASITQSGVIAGTPLYMSPEQAEGLPVDHRSDLFSLGSVLYAMCTGRPPFRADGYMAVMRRVADETPRPVREVNPDVPGWLGDVIARLHAKDPAERFASAADVARVLAGQLAHLQQPVDPAEPASSRHDLVRRDDRDTPAQHASARRRRWAVAAAVLGVLLAGLGMAEGTGVTRVCSTVIRYLSPGGTLVIQVEDPAVSVTLEGEDVVLSGCGPGEIRLKAGQYRLTASRDGKPIQQQVLSVTSRGRRVVHISREGNVSPQAPPAGATVPAEVDILADTARHKAFRVRKLYEAGMVAADDLRAAEVELAEARLHQAAARNDAQEQDKQFGQLMTQYQEALEEVRKLHKTGAVPQSALEDAEKAVLKARLRWKEWRASRGEPGPPPVP
jgi:hypothetical protein